MKFRGASLIQCLSFFLLHGLSDGHASARLASAAVAARDRPKQAYIFPAGKMYTCGGAARVGLAAFGLRAGIAGLALPSLPAGQQALSFC